MSLVCYSFPFPKLNWKLPRSSPPPESVRGHVDKLFFSSTHQCVYQGQRLSTAVEATMFTKTNSCVSSSPGSSDQAARNSLNHMIAPLSADFHANWPDFVLKSGRILYLSQQSHVVVPIWANWHSELLSDTNVFMQALALVCQLEGSNVPETVVDPTVGSTHPGSSILL
jgi:hypothetical protein